MSSLILHLSDLHFGNLQDADLWFGQLRDDLNDILPRIRFDGTKQLEALVISGDVADQSTQEEYRAAEKFLSSLKDYFGLNSSQILIVPGNHDLNWKLSDNAYKATKRSDYKGSLATLDLIKKDIIFDNSDYIEIPNPKKYKSRFKYFSEFYQNVIGEPYPEDYEKQYKICYLVEQNLLILGLNSAWKLNHSESEKYHTESKERKSKLTYRFPCSINSDALTNALDEIDRILIYKNSRFKVAVWHHPLNSPDEDRIKDHDFMQRLVQHGFQLALHGHIHKATAENYNYRNTDLSVISGGTFGAPISQWVSGNALQYNLLRLQDKELLIYIRKRVAKNGIWKADGWENQNGLDTDRYKKIELALRELSIDETLARYVQLFTRSYLGLSANNVDDEMQQLEDLLSSYNFKLDKKKVENVLKDFWELKFKSLSHNMLSEDEIDKINKIQNLLEDRDLKTIDSMIQTAMQTMNTIETTEEERSIEIIEEDQQGEQIEVVPVEQTAQNNSDGYVVVIGLVILIGLIGISFHYCSQPTQNKQPSNTNSPQLQQSLVPSPPQSSTSNPTSSPSPKVSADEWMYIGDIDKNLPDSLEGTPLLDSWISPSIFPSVNSVVTITNRIGVNLRKDKPQPPEFEYENQELLGLAKYGEKFEVLETATVPSQKRTDILKVWAKVRRCSHTCN